MGERLAPWRAKPPQVVVDLLHELSSSRLYLVHRTGPTSFYVREDGSETKRKVMVGSRMTCTCSPLTPNGSCKELCIHILFVMTKVLRVPPSNTLVWQLSLTDRELDEVLMCSTQSERIAHDDVPAKAKPAEKTPLGQVKRRPLDEEEPCPICYDDMAGCDLDLLVYCRFGCGRNVHGKCMSVFRDHQIRTLGKDLTCPLCRTDWGDFKWIPPPAKKKPKENPNKGVHYGTKCGACRKAPLVGKRMRCLVCADYDLCEDCFNSGQHPQHPFACRETPTSFATAAERPLMMPSITRLASGAGAGATAYTMPAPAVHTTTTHTVSGPGSGPGSGFEAGSALSDTPAVQGSSQPGSEGVQGNGVGGGAGSRTRHGSPSRGPSTRAGSPGRMVGPGSPTGHRLALSPGRGGGSQPPAPTVTRLHRGLSPGVGHLPPAGMGAEEWLAAAGRGGRLSPPRQRRLQQQGLGVDGHALGPRDDGLPPQPQGPGRLGVGPQGRPRGQPMRRAQSHRPSAPSGEGDLDQHLALDGLGLQQGGPAGPQQARHLQDASPTPGSRLGPSAPTPATTRQLSSSRLRHSPAKPAGSGAGTASPQPHSAFGSTVAAGFASSSSPGHGGHQGGNTGGRPPTVPPLDLMLTGRVVGSDDNVPQGATGDGPVHLPQLHLAGDSRGRGPSNEILHTAPRSTGRPMRGLAYIQHAHTIGHHQQPSSAATGSDATHAGTASPGRHSVHRTLSSGPHTTRTQPGSPLLPQQPPHQDASPQRSSEQHYFGSEVPLMSPPHYFPNRQHATISGSGSGTWSVPGSGAASRSGSRSVHHADTTAPSSRGSSTPFTASGEWDGAYAGGPPSGLSSPHRRHLCPSVGGDGSGGGSSRGGSQHHLFTEPGPYDEPDDLEGSPCYSPTSYGSRSLGVGQAVQDLDCFDEDEQQHYTVHVQALHRSASMDGKKTYSSKDADHGHHAHSVHSHTGCTTEARHTSCSGGGSKASTHRARFSSDAAADLPLPGPSQGRESSGVSSADPPSAGGSSSRRWGSPGGRSAIREFTLSKSLQEMNQLPGSAGGAAAFNDGADDEVDEPIDLDAVDDGGEDGEDDAAGSSMAQGGHAGRHTMWDGDGDGVLMGSVAFDVIPVRSSHVKQEHSHAGGSLPPMPAPGSAVARLAEHDHHARKSLTPPVPVSASRLCDVDQSQCAEDEAGTVGGPALRKGEAEDPWVEQLGEIRPARPAVTGRRATPPANVPAESSGVEGGIPAHGSSTGSMLHHALEQLVVGSGSNCTRAAGTTAVRGPADTLESWMTANSTPGQGRPSTDDDCSTRVATGEGGCRTMVNNSLSLSLPRPGMLYCQSIAQDVSRGKEQQGTPSWANTLDNPVFDHPYTLDL